MAKSIRETGLATGLGDKERDACMHRLGDYYAQGRLTADELDRSIQAILAAETEADLDAAMAEVPLRSETHVREPVTPDGSRASATLRVVHRVAHRVAAVAALASGGVLLAAVGPRSNGAEFAAGTAVASLGFAAHWWVSTRSAPLLSTPQVAEQQTGARPPAEVASDEPASDEPASDEPASDEPTDVAVPARPTVAPRPTRPRPVVGRGDGTIPTQRDAGG